VNSADRVTLSAGSVTRAAAAEPVVRVSPRLALFKREEKGAMMQHDPPSLPTGSAPPETDSDRRPDDPLTPAQRAFARLLGGLLAELWASEPTKPAPRD
jgi:hypothetical protein